MMNESSIGVPSTPDAGAISAGESPTPSQGSGAQNEQRSADLNVQPDQGTAQPTQSSDDPLAGFPSNEELQAAVANKTPFAEQAARIKGAYDALKPQFSELETKFKVFEPVADRFQTAEELQELAELKDSLFGYQRDDRNQLVPSTQKAAEMLSAKYPVHSNYLWADMAEGMTRDPDTGQEITRIDLALKGIAEDPARRSYALRLLGGVEPTSVAPTWAPSDEELAAIDDPEYPTREGKELQGIYSSLPYDEREELRGNTPDFIKNYLKKEQYQRNLVEQNRIATERETRQHQQNEAWQRQQAEQAGHQAVERGFRQVFTEYRDSVVENSKFIAPLDPSSPEAQQMGPEAVAQFNQSAQRVNTGVGKFIALATAALAVPDTAWVAQDVLKELGVPDELLQKFNAARQEYANNTRDAGELSFEAQQNRNTGSGLGTLQSNARRAASNLKASANLVSKSLKSLLSDFFEMKAGNYNQTLNGAATARPSVNGAGFNPATAAESRPPRQPSEIWSPQSIERFLPR